MFVLFHWLKYKTPLQKKNKYTDNTAEIKVFICVHPYCTELLVIDYTKKFLVLGILDYFTLMELYKSKKYC